MSLFGFARGDQMVAINRPGLDGVALAQLAIARVSRGKFSLGAVLQVLHLVRNERLPRGSKRHVVGRHGEGGATCKSGDVIQAHNGPACKLEALKRRPMPHGLDRTLLSGVHSSVRATPGTTLQVINNLIAADVLGIEVRGVIHRIRQRSRLCKVLIEIPARERIGDAVHYLGLRKATIIYIGQISLVALHIVLRSKQGELGATRITQVVLDKCNTLALDRNVAIKVLVGIALIVLGDFRRDK